MQAALILLALGLLCSSCAAERAPAAEAAAPAGPLAASARPAAPHARAARCRAEPGTVYGQEPVVFAIEAEPSGAGPLQVVLLDQAQKLVLERTFTVPGQLRLDGVSSGDFWLQVGTEPLGPGPQPTTGQTSCAVTVNRELTRATPGQN